MKTIGIDIGTTNTKVVVYDAVTSRVIGKVQAPTPIADSPLGRVREADSVVTLVKALIIDAVNDVDVSDISAVSASCVGEECVLMDTDFRPIAPVIPWYDNRGEMERTDFLKVHDSGLFNGEIPGPWYALFKLLWMKRHHRDTVERCALFTDLGSFVLGSLCGHYRMDWSHASRVGAFHIVDKTWNTDVIDATDLDPNIFPRLVPSGTVIGTMTDDVARELGLPQHVVVCAGGHDHFCAAYSEGVRQPGDVLVSAGTSEACFILTETPATNLNCTFPAEQGCFVHGGLYYILISIPSGHLFQQWKQLLYPNVSDEDILVETLSDGLKPRRNQFSLSDGLDQWTLTGFGRFFDKTDVMRAVQEGLASVSADAVSELFSLSNRAGHLFVAGKPTSHPLWLKLRKEAYGRDLHTLHEVESAALGAAMLAVNRCESL